MKESLKMDRIRAGFDGVDEVATNMERKWGVDRLRRLVSDDLRERFDRQCRKFNEAIFPSGGDYDLREVEKHANGLKKGWEMLDRVASENGAKPLQPEIWEVLLPSGKVAAFVRETAESHAVIAEGRYVEVWTVDEIGRLIEGPWKEIGKAKKVFPGAIVTKAGELLDDDIPF